MLRDLFKLAGKATLIVVILGVLGSEATYDWGGREGLGALLWAAVIVAGTAVVSLVPLAWAMQGQRRYVLIAWCIAMSIRIMLSLSLMAVVYKQFGLSQTAFAIWGTGFYVTLLAWETLVVVRIVSEGNNKRVEILIPGFGDKEVDDVSKKPGPDTQADDESEQAASADDGSAMETETDDGDKQTELQPES